MAAMTPPGMVDVQVTQLEVTEVDSAWFTPREVAAAELSEDPHAHRLRRLAGKRAVLMALRLPADDPSYGAAVEIETTVTGRPVVRLGDHLVGEDLVDDPCVLDVSLSSDGEAATALAVLVATIGSAPISRCVCLVRRTAGSGR